MATTTRWTRFRGDSHPVEFSITDKSGTPVDLTGWTAFLLTIASEQNPADATTQLVQIAGTITNAAGGLVSFDGTTIGPLDAGTVFYDVQATDAASNIRTVAKGPLSLVQDITK